MAEISLYGVRERECSGGERSTTGQRREHGNLVAAVDRIFAMGQATIHRHEQACPVRRENRVRCHQICKQLLDRTRHSRWVDTYGRGAKLLGGTGEQKHFE
jgi:hypothetical protein